MYNVILFFFFNDTATTEIYTLSLHDALPIFVEHPERPPVRRDDQVAPVDCDVAHRAARRSEEHTSELQSQSNLVCRLLLEKKNGHSEIHKWIGSKIKPRVMYNRNLPPVVPAG